MKAAVVTISDSVARGRRTDRSGPATLEVLRQHGFDVTQQRAVVDDRDEIERTLIQLSEQVQLIVTTGGTGISERDVTPEATRAVCSKLIDGIPEKMRADGLGSTEFAILSRGVCGVRGARSSSIFPAVRPARWTRCSRSSRSCRTPWSFSLATQNMRKASGRIRHFALFL